MKKHLKLSLLTFLFVSLLILLGTKNVNAAIARANITYGEITDEGVTTTVRFHSDMTGINYDNPEKNIYWTQSGNTYTTVLKPGSYYYMFKDNGDNSIEYANIAVPVEITVGTELTLSDTLSEISVKDTSIASLNGNVIKGLKAGKTTYSATAEIEGSTVDFTWDLTVADDSTEEDSDKFEWTDFSNLTLDWNSNSDYSQINLSLKNDTGIENHSYYVYYTNTNSIPSIKTNKYGSIEKENNSIRLIFDKDTHSLTGFMDLREFFELNNSNLYLTIVEEQSIENTSNYTHKIVKTMNVKRPSELPLGTRFKLFFFDDYTSSYLYYPCIDSSVRNINLKIGKVSDKQILLNVKNGTSDCLQKLLEYSKADTSPIYTGTIPLGRSESITSKLNLSADEYLYVYYELEDVDGKYYPVEDISLFKACVSDSVGANLFDALSDEFVWDLEDDSIPEKEKNPTILPDAGSKSTIALIIILISVTICAYLRLRKYKDI